MAELFDFLKWLFSADDRVNRYKQFVQASIAPLLSAALLICAAGLCLVVLVPELGLPGLVLTASGGVLAGAAGRARFQLWRQNRAAGLAAAPDPTVADGAPEPDPEPEPEGAGAAERGPQ